MRSSLWALALPVFALHLLPLRALNPLLTHPPNSPTTPLQVRHRNVVQFIGACTVRPNLCIVFEYMRGGSVYDYVRRHGALRVAAVLRIAAEVCRGMDYLHRRKIVHRDLKVRLDD